MGTKGSKGIPGIIGPRGSKGSKGENGIGTKGEKGDAPNVDPRQRANWKQCAWRSPRGIDSGKIKVRRRLNFSAKGGCIQFLITFPLKPPLILWA